MATVTKPILLDETGKEMSENLHKIALAIGGETRASTWEDIRILCRNGKMKQALQIGQEFTFKKDGADVTAVIVDFIEENQNGSIKIKDSNLQNGVIFQTKNVAVSSTQFDAREAFYAQSAAMTAGTYHFTVGQHTWAAGEVGKTYQFTLSADIPANAKLVWQQGYNVTLEGGQIKIYQEDGKTDTGITATMTEGTSGTDLGTINNAPNGNFNSCQRAIYGSGRWKESAIRQMLNSDGAAGTYWTSQTKFDIYPSWNASLKGWMNGLSTSFSDFVTEVEIDTVLNNVSDATSTVKIDTTTDKFFFPSKAEMFAGTDGAYDTGTPLALYKDGSTSETPHTGNDAVRIKTWNGSATYWWFRSPNVSNANSVWIAYPTGSCYYSYASTAYGVAPAFVIA